MCCSTCILDKPMICALIIAQGTTSGTQTQTRVSAKPGLWTQGTGLWTDTALSLVPCQAPFMQGGTKSRNGEMRNEKLEMEMVVIMGSYKKGNGK